MYLHYGTQCLPSVVTVSSQNYSTDMTDILLEWNAEDPVSQVEINRNTILEGVQGNRNPFIDNPAFATAIWGGPQAQNRFDGSIQLDTEIPSVPASLVATNITASETTLTWVQSTDNVGVLGYRIYNGTVQIASASTPSYVLSGLTADTNYTLSIKAFDAAGNISNASNSVAVRTLAGIPPTTPTTSVVFMNEIHYDNTSADVGEGVEIAGTAGTDLTGWSIIPYNGNGGVSYTPAGSLSGIIPNQSNGFGTVFVSINGLQNGAPDGLALVNNLGNVIQFLSYEGTFAATNGPASGITSTDIGVSEIGTEIVGLSLQLKGSGNQYSDFTWQTSVASTYGNINNGQSFSIIAEPLTAPTNLVATNVTATTSTLSWTAGTSNASFEIYNGSTLLAATTATNITLNGLTPNTTYAITVIALDANDNTSTASNVVSITTLNNTIPTPAGAVFINEIHYDNAGTDLEEGIEIAGLAGTDLTGWKIIPYNGSGGASYTPIGNLSGTIPNQLNGYGTISVPIAGLQNGSPDGIVLVDAAGKVIQFLSYEGTFTATNGPAAGMTSTDIGEAVEIAGYAGTDLTGWSIVPYNGSGGVSYTPIGNLSGIIPDQLNGYGTVSVNITGLQNGSPDGIALVDASGKVIQFLSYEGTFTATNGPAAGITSTDIGIAEASTAAIGTSLQLTGVGFTYADFTWQAINTTFGAINKGQFFGNASDILVVIPIAEARAKTDGEIVTVTGVLTVSDQFAGSAYLQDATGAIAVFDKSVHGTGLFKIGDSITVTGTRSSFSEQVQISPVSAVTNNGLPNQPIVPLTITLSEMANHPAELVRIENRTFPKPGAMMFGNSNTDITDASGTAQLRIDADVNELTGFAQPENCPEIIGVVGNYFATQQLLPRMRTDLPCANKYEQTGNDLAISKEKTLDIATWNIAWFGDETNSPTAGKTNSDALQKAAVKNVLQQLDADIYAVEEISDDILFAQMVSEMNDYSYVLSEATSYPNDFSSPKQKVGFIYKNKTVTPVSTKVLLKTIHPFYNGGDVSALANYPDADKSRFFASGRLPFMMTANVTIDGNQKQINIIDLHARANTSGDAQGKYDMRKFDVEVLKDSLKAQYPDANLVLLGDYNDDVDYTVSDVTTTVSTYEAYVNDSSHFNVLTKTLSDAGFRSYVTYENMIDHIAVSNELAHLYINESARVHYEFYTSDYTKTASDHFPVSVRLQLKELTLDASSATNITCNGEANGTATVSVSGGIAPYTYTWSTNEINNTNSISNLNAGTYSVIINDALNNKLTANFSITEPSMIAIPSTNEETVYYGYTNASCTTLSAGTVTGGVLPYTYLWSTGATTSSIAVCPTATSTYTLIVKDANGCISATEKIVNVIDVRCGNNSKNPKVEICHNGKTICIDENAVASHLAHGDRLGTCESTNNDSISITDVNVFPNPFVNNVDVSINISENAKVDFLVYNFYGQIEKQNSLEVKAGKSITKLELSELSKGYYFLKIAINGKVKEIKYLIKQ